MAEKLVCSICKEVTEHRFIKNVVIGRSSYSIARGKYECTECRTLRKGMVKGRM